jgi:hypothetical protein
MPAARERQPGPLPLLIKRSGDLGVIQNSTGNPRYKRVWPVISDDALADIRTDRSHPGLGMGTVFSSSELCVIPATELRLLNPGQPTLR